MDSAFVTMSINSHCLLWAFDCQLLQPSCFTWDVPLVWSHRAMDGVCTENAFPSQLESLLHRMPVGKVHGNLPDNHTRNFVTAAGYSLTGIVESRRSGQSCTPLQCMQHRKHEHHDLSMRRHDMPALVHRVAVQPSGREHHDLSLPRHSWWEQNNSMSCCTGCSQNVTTGLRTWTFNSS